MSLLFGEKYSDSPFVERIWRRHSDESGRIYLIGAQSSANGRLEWRRQNLPDASSKSCWLNSGAWQFPTYENADMFINRLAKQGMLIRDPVVDAALQGQQQDLTLRTIQRRFVQNIGMTHGRIQQIERARQATLLLKQNLSILDVVELAGFADQPHLTRALKQYTGQTPAQIQHESLATQMSFLFKTETAP